MLTVTNFAQEMGVTRQTVLNWIEKGVIMAVKPVKEYRINESELKRLKAGEKIEHSRNDSGNNIAR